MKYETDLKDFENLTIETILKKLEYNAYYSSNDKPNVLYLSDDLDIIKLAGYTIEDGYESYSSAPFISINNEILYDEESKSTGAYRVHVFKTGKFENFNEAINYLEDYLQDRKMYLTDHYPVKCMDEMTL